MDNEKKAEIRDPGKKTLAQWLIDHIREQAPKPLTTIPWSAIEALTGFRQDSPRLSLALITVRKKLLRGTPPYEFKARRDGLYFLDLKGRVANVGSRKTRARRLYRESLASAATIDPNQLDAKDRRTLDHHVRVAAQLYEQAKKLEGRRFLRAKKDPDPPAQLQ